MKTKIKQPKIQSIIRKQIAKRRHKTRLAHAQRKINQAFLRRTNRNSTCG